jgi:hypothetical protein
MSPESAAVQARQIDDGWLRRFKDTHEILCLAAAARKVDIEPYKNLANSAYAFWTQAATPEATQAVLKRLFSPGIGALHNLKRLLMVEIADTPTGRHEERANTPMKQEPHTPPSRSIGDAWSGLRGVLQQAYSTKIIKGILGKSGLPISKMKYMGTFKGPVLDEADHLVSSLNEQARDGFVVVCVEEILAFEKVKAANLSQHGREVNDQTVQDLRLVLARFGHDLKEFAPA